jgi:Flp pilus assembly protein TadB
MSPPRRLRWDVSSPPPKHPFRDSAILYGVFAVIIVIVAWASGSSPATGIVVAVAFYVLAVGWSWWRWNDRLKKAASKRPFQNEP